VQLTPRRRRPLLREQPQTGRHAVPGLRSERRSARPLGTWNQERDHVDDCTRNNSC
jgi:hypothetical protein